MGGHKGLALVAVSFGVVLALAGGCPRSGRGKGPAGQSRDTRSATGADSARGAPGVSDRTPRVSGAFGPSDSAAADSTGLEVLCGGSFREPMEKLADLFEKETGTHMVLSFGQSEDLLPHVKLHERGDVFVTHDPYVEYTKEAGALLRSAVVGTLAPVLVVAKGNPKGIARLEDLARPGVSVCLPNPEFSTCGEMVFALLEKKGIKDAVSANVGNALFRAHAEVASAISLGHRDAGIMWNGVAHNWLDKLDVVPTPYEYDREIRVAVIGLSYSKQKELVTRFLDFADRRGESVFREYGYAR